MTQRLRGSTAATAAGATAVGVVLAVALAGHRDDFAQALRQAPVWVLLAATALQLVALLSRCEAWRTCVAAAGGVISRRRLFHAGGLGNLGSLLNSQIGTAARIAVLRRSGPDEVPNIPALIAAEVPILAIEAALAVLASSTLVGPLGLPWWAPLAGFALAVCGVFGLRRLAGRGHGVWAGLAVLRSADGRIRVTALVLIAVFAQIARNWLVLRALGVDASIFDATAVLIAMGVLSQLPLGPTVGARRGRPLLRRTRRLDRVGCIEPAAAGAARRRRGRGDDPRRGRRCADRRGRRAPDRHRNRRRPLLRAMGRHRCARAPARTRPTPGAARGRRPRRLALLADHQPHLLAAGIVGRPSLAVDRPCCSDSCCQRAAIGASTTGSSSTRRGRIPEIGARHGAFPTRLLAPTNTIPQEPAPLQAHLTLSVALSARGRRGRPRWALRASEAMGWLPGSDATARSREERRRCRTFEAHPSRIVGYHDVVSPQGRSRGS